MILHNVRIKRSRYEHIRTAIDRYGKTFVCAYDKNSRFNVGDLVRFIPVNASGYSNYRADSVVYLVTDIRRDVPDLNVCYAAFAFVKSEEYVFDCNKQTLFKVKK